VIKALQRRHPDLRVWADDAGIWLLDIPSALIKVRLESSTGNCPFLIESSLNPERMNAAGIGEAINMVSTMLASHG